MKINRVQSQYQNIKQNQIKNNIKSNEDIKREKSVDVEISSSAKELAEKVKESKSVEYSQGVEEIRAAILDGTYKLDSEKIAEKIIEKINNQKGSGN